MEEEKIAPASRPMGDGEVSIPEARGAVVEVSRRSTLYRHLVLSGKRRAGR